MSERKHTLIREFSSTILIQLFIVGVSDRPFLNKVSVDTDVKSNLEHMY